MADIYEFVLKFYGHILFWKKQVQYVQDQEGSVEKLAIF
jgi:hypothetical protein